MAQKVLHAGTWLIIVGVLFVALQFGYEWQHHAIGQNTRSGDVGGASLIKIETSYVGVLIILIGAAMMIAATFANTHEKGTTT